MTSIEGMRISRIGGILESRTSSPAIEGYTAVLELEDSSGTSKVFLLAESDSAEIDVWPDEAKAMPAQVLYGPPTIEGERILKSFRVHVGAGSQLFLLLESGRICGLVNTMMGSVLHVERVTTVPALRGAPTLTDEGGSPLAASDLVSLVES